MSVVHGCASVIGHKGVLIRGVSGRGKSLLTHELIAAAHTQNLYSAWIADDQVGISGVGSAIIARPVHSIQGRHELRFGGVERHNPSPATRIDLVVDLITADNLERMPKQTATTLLSDESSAIPLIRVPSGDRHHAIALIFARLLP